MKSNYLFSTLTLMIYGAALCAESPETPSSLECTKEELMTFFPQQVVQSVLIKANLTKEEAATIAQKLSQKDREFSKIVEEKAEKLESNPFKDLNHRDVAVKIYNETLYEVFAEVLKSHGITNDDQIQAFLEKVKGEKSKLFIECIRKQQQQQMTRQ